MAARYVLDTNILVAALKGQPGALMNRLAGLVPERLCLSAIVLGELLTGAEKSSAAAKRRAAVAVITHGMESLPFDADDAAAYARIRAALESKGVGIGPLDLQIAAQCVARGLVLVTDNLREFRRVPGLACENWLRKA